MSTTTSIVPLQTKTSSIMPKPTQAQMIEALVQQIIAQRTAENLKRKETREKLKAAYDKEAAKWSKKKVALSDLGIEWGIGRTDGEGYIRHERVVASPKMVQLAKEYTKHHDLITNPAWVRDEVKASMQKEMMSSIMDQPGIKEALQSAIIKLGL